MSCPEWGFGVQTAFTPPHVFGIDKTSKFNVKGAENNACVLLQDGINRRSRSRLLDNNPSGPGQLSRS